MNPWMGVDPWPNTDPSSMPATLPYEGIALQRMAPVQGFSTTFYAYTPRLRKEKIHL